MSYEIDEKNDKKYDDNPANRDPLTGAPGAHPVGVGVGAASAGAAGAAIGAAVGGPVGAVVGAAVGGIAGGYAGKGVAENIDPTVEDAYWRETYPTRPYAVAGTSYDEYAPAYRYGWESRSRYAGKSYDEVENDLERGWDQARERSSLAWHQAKDATRDAWHRVEHALPGDADRDGR
jgi:hypothetical protein